MSFEFIHELSEARLFRTPARIGAITSSQLADNFFNAILAMQTMHSVNPKIARRYAIQTFQGGQDGWRSTGSDLHNMAFMLKNPDRFSDKVTKDRHTAFPALQYQTWLRNMSQGKIDREFDRRFLLRLQKDLGVNNLGLKSARRLLADWDTATDSEKKLAASKIYQGLNHNLKQADLFAPYTKTVTKKNLLLTDIPPAKGIPLSAKVGIAAIGGYLAGKSLAKL